MRDKLVLQVLAALVEYVATKGHSPTVRDLCVATGWSGDKEVWWALQKLESVDMIRWPTDGTGRRLPRGIELLVDLKEPVRIPIVGYMNAPADFVPGERWVGVFDDGRIVIRKGEEEWMGAVINPTLE